MTTPQPRTETDIRGVAVGFLRRDVRQISDSERGHVEELVEWVLRDADPDQTVTRITIETDYPDPDRLAYVASYRVSVRKEPDVTADEGEHHGGGDPR